MDEPLAIEEPQREFLVVTRSAHRDDERDAIDPDLERVLDGHLVALAIAEDGGDHPRRDRVGPPVAHARSGEFVFGSMC